MPTTLLTVAKAAAIAAVSALLKILIDSDNLPDSNTTSHH